MEKVYIETTIPSYLTARPSSHPQRQAHQEHTRLWWENERHKYDLYISVHVWGEAERGDPDAAARRLAALDGIAFLDTFPEADSLALEIIRLLDLPPRAVTDASHLALAILHKMDYLLTWNCTHISNPQLQRRLIKFCQEKGLHTPVICTPEHLTAAVMVDEIVEEVREARAALAARFDYDIVRIHAWARQEEKRHAQRLAIRANFMKSTVESPNNAAQPTPMRDGVTLSDAESLPKVVRHGNGLH